MDNHIFRSALSGFNRQDVMEYIERTQKQAEETAAGLEARVEELRQAEETARGELEACAEEKDDLARQLEDMTLRYNHAKNNWEAQSEAKDSFRRDVAQRDQTIKELTGENQRLFRQVQELEGQMDALRREKEKLTQLELDARQRADEVLAQAQAQAQEVLDRADVQARRTEEEAGVRARTLLGEAEVHIGETAAQYEKMFRSFETITGHITAELRKLDVTAAQLPIGLAPLKEALTELQEKAKER